MKAAIKAGKERFDVREVAVPNIGADECLIKIHYCAICVFCYNEWLRDGADDIFGPGVTGHEISGVIQEVGANVKQWQVGDEVLTYFYWHCGVCLECQAGKTTYCTNRPQPVNVMRGYAEYTVALERCILPAPKGVHPKYSSLITDMVGTPMHAIRRAFSVELDRHVVAVWGLGPVGLFAVQGLRTVAGVKRIIALDPLGSRREAAFHLGADEVLNPFQDDTEERLKAENDGRGVNYAFNCALPSAEMAYQTLKMDGYLMNITGGYISQSQMEKRIDGCFYFNKDEHEDNLQLIMDGKLRLEPVLSHEFPLNQINEAMELRAKHPEQSLKVAIKCI
jgi:propanol-preferring alcohol dehydrogenase